MSDDATLPSLEFLYSLKKSLMEAVLQFGPDAPVAEPDAAALGLSGKFSFSTLLAAVDKMIEAIATLRDFSAEPLSAQEQQDLDEIWQLEHDIAARTPAHQEG